MKKFKILTLGCRCNQYESQKYFDQLVFNKWHEDLNSPDLIIINSCSVTHKADRSSYLLAKKQRKEHLGAKIFVTGCATTFCENKKLDVIFVENKDKDDFLLKNGLIKEIPFEGITRFQKRTRAFVKVQDGCNRFCSYCTIPYFRGRSRSRDIDEITKEVVRLTENRYKEIILTGINLGDFKPHLCDLLEKLRKIENLKRIRLSSIDPEDIDDRLIDYMRTSNKMAHSLHISLQSGSNEVLSRMNRKYTKEGFKELLNKIQKKIPEMTFSTDIIVGFPGETDKDFEDSIQMVKDMKFSKVHIFPFSVRPKARAASFPNQIDKKTILKRKKVLEEEAKKAAFNLREKFIGKELEILLENEFDKSKKYIGGISRNGLMIFLEKCKLAPNDLVRAKVSKNAQEHLLATVGEKK